MKNLIPRITQVKSAVFFTALFITVFILYQLFDYKSMELKSMDKLIISQATADGISIKSRIDLFYNSLFAGILILIVNLSLLSFVFIKLKINENQRGSLQLLSIIGISIIFTGLLGIETKALVAFLQLILSYKLLTYALGNSGVRYLKPFKTDILSNVIIALSFFVYFADLILSGTESLILTYSISLILFTLIFGAVSKSRKLNLRKLVQLCLPFSFVTVISFIIVETLIFQYLKGNDFINYRSLFLIVSLVAYGLFCIPFILKRVKSYNASTIFKFILTPSILFGFSLLLYYFPVVNQNKEMFEYANPANALMKIFHYQEIPFVDFISSHMFSEQWYGIIYAAIFGYDSSLDFQIYAFFNFSIYLFVAYFTLNKIFNKPAYSLLFTVSFPFLYSVFSFYLLLAFFPFILLRKAFKNQSIKNYTAFIASLVALCIWRLDLGYAALLSSLFYFLVIIVFTKQNVQWRNLIKAGLLVLFSLISLLLIAILLRDFDYISQNIKVALDYFSADQAHGFTNIAHEYPHQFYIIHFLLPFTAIISIAYIIYLLVKARENNLNQTDKHSTFLLHASLFLFFISLSNAQRGLVRHGFAETNDMMLITTFHLAVSILLLYIFRNKIVKWKTSFFYVSCFVLFIGLKFFPFKAEQTLFDAAVTKNAFLDLKTELALKTDLKRTKVDEHFYNENIKDFKKFLNQNLTQEETFLDFSNMPMLYYYTDRKSPGYFCQNLQNTVDDYLQLTFINEFKNNKVPITVFSSTPATWFDNTDGIPNAMRYYLIAEHIYKNYEPYKIISNKRIWIKKDLKKLKNKTTLNNQYPLDTLSNQPILYDYRKTAYYLYDFYKNNNFKDLKKIQELKVDSNQYISTKNLKEIPHHAYLLIEFKSNINEETISLTARNALNQDLDLFRFDVINKEDNQYLVRISNSYHWHRGDVASLHFGNFTGNELPSIKKVTLLKDIRNED